LNSLEVADIVTPRPNMLKPKMKMFYLYAFTIGLGVFEFGWAEFGNTQTAPLLAVKFGWSVEEDRLYNTLISNSSLVGLLVGSLFAGKLISYGRHKAIHYMNGLVIIGTSISLIRTIPTIIIGRFVSGFAAGVLTTAMTKCIVETLPNEIAGMFGAATAISINFAGVICLVLGLLLPDDPAQYKDDNNWRVIYGFPYIFVIMQFLLLSLVFKYEPVNFSIKHGKETEARKFLEMLYEVPEIGKQV
jgi:MFS family permease